MTRDRFGQFELLEFVFLRLLCPGLENSSERYDACQDRRKPSDDGTAHPPGEAVSGGFDLGRARALGAIAHRAWPLDFPAPQAVAHDRKPTTRLPAGSSATGAARRPHCRTRRRRSRPKLDVERRLEDARVASLFRQLFPAERGGRTVLERRPPPFVRTRCPASSPAAPSTTPRPSPTRNAHPP